jgi:hypothetical protein
MGMRILLLLSIVWIIRLTTPLFYILGRPISGRELILIGGGLFLLAKATLEIHERLEGEEGHSSARVRPSFVAVIIQIALLDIVFSLDYCGGCRIVGNTDISTRNIRIAGDTSGAPYLELIPQATSARRSPFWYAAIDGMTAQ